MTQQPQKITKAQSFRRTHRTLRSHKYINGSTNKNGIVQKVLPDLNQLSQATGISVGHITQILSPLETFFSKETLAKLPSILSRSGGNIISIRTKLLQAEFPRARRAGVISPIVSSYLWQGFGDGKISKNIFDLLFLAPKHPTVIAYQRIVREQSLKSEDIQELQHIIERFKLASRVAKGYSWKKHPRIGRLAVLELDRLLETETRDWHFNYPVNPAVIKVGKETFKPFEFTLKIAEPYNAEITNPNEINTLRTLINYLTNNRGASLERLVELFDAKYKRTDRINNAIEKALISPSNDGFDNILAEYIRAYPHDIKRILIKGMPAFTQGMKVPDKMDLETIDKLIEFYGNVFPEFLERHKLPLMNPFEPRAKQLREMLNKKKKLKNIRPVRFRLSPGKTILDNFPGATGQDCLKLDQTKQRIRDPTYHTFQIINLETGSNEGTINCYERTVNGERHLVSTTMQPKARLLRQVNPSELYRSLVTGLFRLAAQKKITRVSSTARHGETSNRAEIDARLKTHKQFRIPATQFFPDTPPHRWLFDLSHRKK